MVSREISDAAFANREAVKTMFDSDLSLFDSPNGIKMFETEQQTTKVELKTDEYESLEEIQIDNGKDGAAVQQLEFSSLQGN